MDGAGPRRHQRVVGDVDLIQRDVLRGGRERLRCRCGLCDICIDGGDGAVQSLPSLVEHLTGLEIRLYQRISAVKLLLGQHHLRSLLCQGSHRLPNGLPCLQHQGLGFGQRGLQVLAVHHGYNLRRRHDVTLVDVERRYPASEFRIDVDLVRFEPSVA